MPQAQVPSTCGAVIARLWLCTIASTMLELAQPTGVAAANGRTELA